MIRNVAVACAIVAGIAASGAWLHYRLVQSATQKLFQLHTETQRLLHANAGSEIPSRIKQLREYIVRSTPVGYARVADTLASLARDLDTLGAQERSWNVGAPAAVDGFEYVPVNLAFNGTFTSAYELVNRIASYPTFSRVEKMNIRRDPARPSRLSIALRFQAGCRLSESPTPKEAP